MSFNPGDEVKVVDTNRSHLQGEIGVVEYSNGWDCVEVAFNNTTLTFDPRQLKAMRTNNINKGDQVLVGEKRGTIIESNSSRACVLYHETGENNWHALVNITKLPQKGDRVKVDNSKRSQDGKVGKVNSTYLSITVKFPGQTSKTFGAKELTILPSKKDALEDALIASCKV